MNTVQDILTIRAERGANASIRRWHDRMEKIDGWIAGDVKVMFPGEKDASGLPVMGNTIEAGLHDIGRLVSETSATVRCEPKSNSKEDKVAAQVRERAAISYWDFGRGPLLEPRLALDLAGGGAAFLLCHANKQASDYPLPLRLDPRNCYPNLARFGHQSAIPSVSEGLPGTSLNDLLYIARITMEMLEAEFGITLPGSGFRAGQKDPEVEVMDFYNAKEKTKAAMLVTPGSTNAGTAKIIQQVENDLGRVPVAFVQTDSFDGAFRGIFDQVTKPMETRNRLAAIVIDSADQNTYAQPVVYDLENEKDIGAPTKPIRMNSPESVATRFPASQLNQAVPYLIDLLNKEVHSGASYPEMRTSEPNASIWSGAGVSAGLGALSTQVRDKLRLLTVLRQEWNRLAFALDVKELDFEKPLSRPLAKVSTYKPSKDIGEYRDNKVTYPMGSGLEYNQRVQLIQTVGSQLMSQMTAMEMIPEIDDPMDEMRKRQLQMAQDGLFQQVLQGADPMTIARSAKVVRMMSQGADIEEVATTLEEEATAQAAQQAQAEQQAQGATPEAPMQPGEAEAQQTALQKGAVPGGENQAPAPSPFAPPPLTSIQVG